MFASSSSFALPLVCRLCQNVTVGRIISNWSAEKCWIGPPFSFATAARHFFPLFYNFSDSGCLMSASCNLSVITFGRSLRFAYGSRLPSQTSCCKVSQTEQCSKFKSVECGFHPVIWQYRACCVEENFELLWCGVMESCPYITGFLTLLTSLSSIQ